MPTFNSSGGSRGGARGTWPPPLFLDQNEAPGPKKIFLRPGLPYLPYPPPPPLAEGLDPENHHWKFEF